MDSPGGHDAQTATDIAGEPASEAPPASETSRPDPDTDQDASDGPPRATGAALYGFFLLFFIGLFAGPIGTLVIWRLRRDEAFVDLHGRQAMDLVLTALGGGVLFFIGRILQPFQLTVASILQWLALAIVALQALQGLWALVDAARGGHRRMVLSLTILRRKGAWAAPMA